MVFLTGFVLRLLGEALLQRRLWGFMAADITDDNDYDFLGEAESALKTQNLAPAARP